MVALGKLTVLLHTVLQLVNRVALSLELCQQIHLRLDEKHFVLSVLLVIKK